MNSHYSKANIFTDVKVEKFPRHLFDKSYTNSFTANHGLLYPHFVKSVVPGDRFDLHTFGRVQLQPLATASMQNIRAYMRYFYVPYRLLWDKWDEFISQDGFVATPLIAPFATLFVPYINNFTDPGSLAHYLGLRLSNYLYGSSADYVPQLQKYTGNTRVSFTLFRWLAYFLIWDTYFRDENLQSKVMDTVVIDEGDNTHLVHTNTRLFTNLLPVSYEKDYFTTALPWQQKGQPVNLSSYLLVGSLPVTNYLSNVTSPDGSISLGKKPAGDLRVGVNQVVGSPEELIFKEFTLNSGISTEDVMGNWSAKLDSSVDVPAESLSTSFNINDLRYSNALQRYLERLALGGNRPAEFYLSMYGVRIDDLRIGQPLYLGGGYEYIHVTPVTQQSESAKTPQGTLAGNGSATPSFGINNPYTADEFGIVMGVFYLRPELNYTQGIDKDLMLFKHLDYYNPVFGHLGEEAVMKSELIVKDGLINYPDENNNDDIFGYQSRYAYLKHSRNEVHGELVGDLSSWLLSAHFNSRTELNSDFITVDQNYDIFAYTKDDVDHYICEFHHDFKVESSMPDFSIPSL